MNNFVFSGNSIIKPSAFKLQSSLLRLRYYNSTFSTFSSCFALIMARNPKLEFCLKLYKRTHKEEMLFNYLLVCHDSLLVGSDAGLVGNDNFLVGRDAGFVGNDNNLVGSDADLVGNDNLLVGSDANLVGNDYNLVGSDNNLVGNDNFLVGNRNFLVGNDDNFSKNPNFINGISIKNGFLLKFFEWNLIKHNGNSSIFKLNRNNLQIYYNN